MKTIALLIVAGLAACGPVDAKSLLSGPSTKTMELSRTHTGAGEVKCQPHRWLDCRSSRTSGENGGD
jgi:hypothetical protein